MNNWPVWLAIALALGGGIHFLFQPLPLDYKNKEYRKHLTKEELATLQRGKTVEKTHKAFQTIWKDYYDEGPLRVTPGANGQYTYTPHGRWQRLKTNGRLMAEFAIVSGKKGYWYEYLPNGQPDHHSYVLPVVVAGDSAIEVRTIYFTYQRPTDTAYVEHLFRNKANVVGKRFFSYDAQGKRPVTDGKRPTR